MAGFVGPASPKHPSVEAALKPFCGHRQLYFPIRPERDVQGLLLVAADDGIRLRFDEMVRQKLIRAAHRVLADVSPGFAPIGCAPVQGLPYVGNTPLAAAGMLGSLWAAGGKKLLQRGSLLSPLAARPLKLRTYRSSDDLLVRKTASAGEQRGRLPASSSSPWSNTREFRAALEGESVPSSLQDPLSKSLTSAARGPQSMPRGMPPPSMATTTFEKRSGPVAHPLEPSLQTAIYTARAMTSAPHQIRAHFAASGCPAMFDPYYHPHYNADMRRNVFSGPSERPTSFVRKRRNLPASDLGLQLYQIELPDPYRTGETLVVTLDAPPPDWEAIHPGAHDACKADTADEVAEEDPDA